MQVLDKAVNDYLLVNLKDLDLSGCLTNDADTNSAALDTFLKSAAYNCPHLHSLNLSDNSLGVPGASALAAAISSYFNVHTSMPYDFNDFQSSLWLSSIDFNNTNLGDEGLIAFIEELDCPYHFDNLWLSNNGIHATGLKCLADMILSNSWFEWMDESGNLDSYFDYIMDVNNLDLLDNPIGIEGVITVGEVLCYCDQQSVDLSRCHLMENVSNPPYCDHDNEHSSLFKEVGSKLYQMQGSIGVRYLTLDDNCFTGERIHILSGFIHLCREQLIFLYTRDCSITSDDLFQLIEIFVDKSTILNELLLWSLDNNEIDDRGVSALMQHIPSLFPLLGKECDDYGVHLDGNPVSRKMVVRLDEMLHPLKG